jgi:hypothetical protein
MANLYADRGFVSFQGADVIDLMKFTISRNDGTKPVPTMSRNRRNTGFVKGNREIKFSFDVAVQDKNATIKVEDIDFEDTDYSLTFEHGGDRYTFIGIDHADDTQDAPAVGTEGKKSFNMVALDIIDQAGNPANFPF